MKPFVLTIIALYSLFSFSQDKQAQALKKANNHIHEANKLAKTKDFVSAEVAYRKALSKQPTANIGSYNLGNSLYKSGHYNEAVFRHKQAAKQAQNKTDRHKAYYNMGNALMKTEQYGQAVEAYKNALRNNPSDEETRYNLALAKRKKKAQDDKKPDNKDGDKNKEDKDNSDNKKDEKKENKDENKKDDKSDNKDKDKDKDKKEDEKDKGDKDKEDDKKDDKGDPKDKKEGDKDEAKKEAQPKPGQLSPQQIKSLLEAMSNQEQKVQDKINAEKQKGVKIKTEKDW